EVNPITLSPYIKGHTHVQEQEKISTGKKSVEDRKSENKDLVHAFGSKQKKLTYEKIDKMKIDATNMNESMTKAGAVLKTPEEEPKIKDESVLTLVPPCDRNAATPESVYNLEDIISSEDLSMMDDLAYEFLNLEAETIKEWKTERRCYKKDARICI